MYVSYADNLAQQLANSYQSLLNEFSSPDLTTVGNYSIGRLIGKGSFGKVYLASHKLTNGSKVVLKSAKKDDANLAREIHHHRQFLHPHIARLYEVIVTENLVWLVLEFCPGDELYNHLLNHGRMEPAKVQKIFTQLVGAVSYVHAKSCVHRDLKLENILLDKHGDVKLVDFGFTREYQGTTSYLQTWCGTICYSAPEMIRGEKYAGEKVDVWSLGIILYALLCGELPFDDDDDSTTKNLILKEEPNYSDHIPQPAKDLLKKLLSKRPLLRPCLGDILKDPWLAEHAPQQQEILKLQQAAPFTTQLEKDVLERMRSAGVDIDMVIENVLSQRCDALAGWWALLLEKEQRKEWRRERKRKEREAEAKSLRRLSAASGRLLSLGGIHESDEPTPHSPRQRGRPLSRTNGTVSIAPELPKVTEQHSPPRDRTTIASESEATRDQSRSTSRPAPPPKDYSVATTSRPTTSSRGNPSTLRSVTTNPDLLSPSYVPPPQRRRPKFSSQPLREQIAWVKGFFKDGTIRRAKSPNVIGGSKKGALPPEMNGVAGQDHGNVRDLRRISTGPTPPSRRMSASGRPDLQTRQTLPARPRINTLSSSGSIQSVRVKRQSLSPGTLHHHSSYRRSSVGLRGRKSTSSSVSSIRTTYQSGHQHTHSKASSTDSNSVASPSGLSSTSNPRLGRSPHSSVKILPSTPTSSSFPSGVRFTRRTVPSELRPNSAFGDSQNKSAFSMAAPSSPGLPVFARRKRSVFKGPMMSHGGSGSPSALNRSTNSSNSRTGSVQGRPSAEMMPGVVEEEDEEEDGFIDEEEYEDIEVDQFAAPGALAPTDGISDLDMSPTSPLPGQGSEHVRFSEGDKSASIGAGTRTNGALGVGADGHSISPLTAESLAKMEAENEIKEAEEEEKLLGDAKAGPL